LKAKKIRRKLKDSEKLKRNKNKNSKKKKPTLKNKKG